MTPYQFGRYVQQAMYKTAAGYYPNAGRNEFDDDLDEEIADVRRMGNAVPQQPMPRRVPGVAQTGGRMGTGKPAPVVPPRATMPAARATAPRPNPVARPMTPPPRPMPTLPKGPGASADLGGGFE